MYVADTLFPLMPIVWRFDYYCRFILFTYTHILNSCPSFANVLMKCGQKMAVEKLSCLDGSNFFLMRLSLH